MSPTNKNEIISIFSVLDSQKASGPKSISIKIVKLMKNDTSDQLAVLFNVSFTCGSFPTILKISKVIPIYKKDSKRNIPIIDLFPYCLTLIKSLNKQCITVFINSLKIIN